jgi:hypothetical protein
VTGCSVPEDDMPNFPWPGRGAASANDDAALAALLSGTQVPADFPAALQPAADVLAALRARPSTDEVAGLTAAMAEFRERAGVSDPSRHTRRRRPSLLTSLMSAKVAAAAAAVAVVVGGMATAAYAGALPATAQGIAHTWIGAPAARYPHSSGSGANRFATGTPSTSAHHGRHHSRRFGCFIAAPHPSGSARPHPSWSPGAHPSWSPGPRPSWSPGPRPSGSARLAPRPSCPAFPKPGSSLRPHKPRPLRGHGHFPPHHVTPHHHPLPRPAPSVPPTPTPSA